MALKGILCGGHTACRAYGRES